MSAASFSKEYGLVDEAFHKNLQNNSLEAAKPTKINFCHFVGNLKEVKWLLALPAFSSAILVFVCAKQSLIESSVKLSLELKKVAKNLFSTFKPAAIKAHLDEHVIGIHAKGLSVAVHNHYKRLASEMGIKTGTSSTNLFLRKILMV